MKLKHKFVSPSVIKTVPLYPETDLLLANSTDDLTKFTSVGQEEVIYDASGAEESAYTVDLY